MDAKLLLGLAAVILAMTAELGSPIAELLQTELCDNITDSWLRDECTWTDVVEALGGVS